MKFIKLMLCPGCEVAMIADVNPSNIWEAPPAFSCPKCSRQLVAASMLIQGG